ncbi:uncharacterized protein LOC108106219 [Drosophila eugracilis]|uniref:uncharacterized protein LOC108106219 n=1 Tax=Drosophila eugracilis TaxID=29029 RepID=UPI0007E6741E|nr:uncharacterized protein LOC108106219 [Drosophila eugracilis]
MRLGWFVFLNCCLVWQMSVAELVYKINKIECQANKARVRDVSCRVKAINWNMAVVNMDCLLILPVVSPVVRLQVFLKDYSNQYKPFLIDVTFKLCEVVNRKNFIPYGVIFWNILKRFTTINESCRLSGHLSAKNGYLDASYLPPFPHGIYQFSFMFSDKNFTSTDILGNVKLFIESMDRIKSKKFRD